MFTPTPPPPPPVQDKIAVFYVIDNDTNNPINEAFVGIDINHGQRQQLARTNTNGLVLFELPQNTYSLSYVVLAEGYNLMSGSIQPAHEFPSTIVQKVVLNKQMTTHTLNFACPEHVSKYHLTYTVQMAGQTSTYEADYSESFELYAFGNNYQYNIDATNKNLSIFDSSISPKDVNIRYDVQLVPEKGYSVNN